MRSIAQESRTARRPSGASPWRSVRGAAPPHLLRLKLAPDLVPVRASFHLVRLAQDAFRACVVPSVLLSVTARAHRLRRLQSHRRRVLSSTTVRSLLLLHPFCTRADPSHAQTKQPTRASIQPWCGPSTRRRAGRSSFANQLCTRRSPLSRNAVRRLSFSRSSCAELTHLAATELKRASSPPRSCRAGS